MAKPWGDKTYISCAATNGASVSEFKTNREILSSFTGAGGDVGDWTYALSDDTSAPNQYVECVSITTAVTPYFTNVYPYPGALATRAEAWAIQGTTGSSDTQLVTKSYALNTIGVSISGSDDYTDIQCVKYEDLSYLYGYLNVNSSCASYSATYFPISVNVSSTGGASNIWVEATMGIMVSTDTTGKTFVEVATRTNSAALTLTSTYQAVDLNTIRSSNKSIPVTTANGNYIWAIRYRFLQGATWATATVLEAPSFYQNGTDRIALFDESALTAKTSYSITNNQMTISSGSYIGTYNKFSTSNRISGISSYCDANHTVTPYFDISRKLYIS